MAKLTLVECLDHQGVLMGKSEYFLFSAATAEENIVNVMLSENLLKKAGFKTTMLDYVSGSTVVLGDEKDINDRSIVTATAQERIDRVLNGEIYERTGNPYSFVLCTAASDRLVASQNALAIKREDATTAQAKVIVQKDNQRKLDALASANARLAERLRKKADGVKNEEPPVTPPPALDKKDDVVEPQPDPVAETVDDAPF